jgi:hypothetical protein
METFMETFRTTSGVFGIALLAAVMSGAGSQVATGAAIDPEVLVAREAARFGDVVVLYGRYEVVFQSGGAEHTRRVVSLRCSSVVTGSGCTRLASRPDGRPGALETVTDYASSRRPLIRRRRPRWSSTR